MKYHCWRYLRLSRYDRVFSRLRYLSFLFSRIDLSEAVTTTAQKTIKSHFLRTALDTPFQDGVMAIFLDLHNLIMGQTLSIYGEKQPSIFELDPTLCQPESLSMLDKAILGLIFQINYVHRVDESFSSEDRESLKSWIKELRQHQLDLVQRLCIGDKGDNAHIF